MINIQICVWSQVHTEEQDAGYLVGLKSPTDTQGTSNAVCVPERRTARSCEVALCFLSVSYEFYNVQGCNVLDFWKRSTFQDPQCVNNRISSGNGCEIKCCVVSLLSLCPLFSIPVNSFLLQRPVLSSVHSPTYMFVLISTNMPVWLPEIYQIALFRKKNAYIFNILR